MTNTINQSQLMKSINTLDSESQKIAGAINNLDSKEKEGDFMDKLSDSLKEVSDAQLQAQNLASNFETGKETSIAKVMVAQQVANLGFNMALNVRNKVVSAYRDIINMPV